MTRKKEGSTGNNERLGRKELQPEFQVIIETVHGCIPINFWAPTGMPVAGETFKLHICAPGFFSPDFENSYGVKRSYWDLFIADLSNTLTQKQVFVTFSWPGQSTAQYRDDLKMFRAKKEVFPRDYGAIEHQPTTLAHVITTALKTVQFNPSSLVIHAHSMAAQAVLSLLGNTDLALSTGLKRAIGEKSLSPEKVIAILQMPAFLAHKDLIKRISRLQVYAAFNYPMPFIGQWIQEILYRSDIERNKLVQDLHDYYREALRQGAINSHVTARHAVGLMNSFDPRPAARQLLNNQYKLHVITMSQDKLVDVDAVTPLIDTMRDIHGVQAKQYIHKLSGKCCHTEHRCPTGTELVQLIERILKGQEYSTE